jgi:hypothetical protein
MKVSDILAKSGVIAGLNDFTGASIDQNYVSMALAFMEQAISDINNDAQIATKTLLFRPTADILPQDQEAYDSGETPDPPKPQPLGRVYVLPKGTRRVIRCFSGAAEIRKTDFSSVAQFASHGAAASLFALNDGKLWLTQPLDVSFTYVPEINLDLANLDKELDVGGEYLPYIINSTAYSLAMSLSTNAIENCKKLASESYDALMSNKRAETGHQFVNPYTSLNRFNMGTGMIG